MTRAFSSLCFAAIACLVAQPTIAQQPSRPPFAEPAALPKGALELRIPVATGGEVAATLYLPSAEGKFPTLITAHGASTASRNQHGWQQFASEVGKAGFALLVYDPPGTGDTPGEWREGPPLQDAAREIESIAAHLARHPKVRADKLGVIGWSRGGWTGPMAAVRSPEIKFFIGISAPSVSPNVANISQRGEELIDEGYSESEVAEINAFRRIVWDYYGTGENYDEAAAAWKTAHQQTWFKKIGLSQPEVATPAVLKTRQLGFYEEGAYDPADDLAKLTKPVLIMLGSADRHIPISDSIAGWRTAFARSGNSDATLVILADAGHGMKLVGGKERMTAKEGHMVMAALPDHPGYLPTLLEWLRRHR